VDVGGDGDVFEEIGMDKETSWQYELQQLKYANDRLKDELRELEKELGVSESSAGYTATPSETLDGTPNALDVAEATLDKPQIAVGVGGEFDVHHGHRESGDVRTEVQEMQIPLRELQAYQSHLPVAPPLHHDYDQTWTQSSQSASPRFAPSVRHTHPPNTTHTSLTPPQLHPHPHSHQVHAALYDHAQSHEHWRRMPVSVDIQMTHPHAAYSHMRSHTHPNSDTHSASLLPMKRPWVSSGDDS